jgi:hypothetical protein
MNEPQRQIPPERKAVYYVGMVMMGVGFLLFLSTFFSGIANFGNFDNFEERVRGEMFRALLGMVLLIVGGIVMKVGAVGLAGSGLKLDPEQARRDIEPWARMGGGMAQDALAEVELARQLGRHLERSGQPQVKVRCPHCKALNDETSKFCGQCGQAL